MPKTKTRLSVAGLMLLAGCAITPDGPSVLVLPGTGKTYQQFQGDDYVCRQIALLQIGGATPQQAAVQSGVASAAVGTAIGAAAGAAMGGGEGAAVGSGVGLVAGSAAGAASSSGYDTQQRYDFSYIQCMYAKGHRVPVWGRFTDGGAVQQGSPAPPPNQPPPPTGGSYPPPPPNHPPPPGSVPR